MHIDSDSWSAVSLHKTRTLVQAFITLCHQKFLEDLCESCPFYHIKYHLLTSLFKTILKLPLTYIHFTLSTALNTDLWAVCDMCHHCPFVIFLESQIFVRHALYGMSSLETCVSLPAVFLQFSPLKL